MGITLLDVFAFIGMVTVAVVFVGILVWLIDDGPTKRETQTKVDEINRILSDTKRQQDEYQRLYTVQVLSLLKANEKEKSHASEKT